MLNNNAAAALQHLTPRLTTTLIQRKQNKALKPTLLTGTYVGNLRTIQCDLSERYEDKSEYGNVYVQVAHPITARQGIGFVYNKAQLGEQPALTNTYAPMHCFTPMKCSGIWYRTAKHRQIQSLCVGPDRLTAGGY